MITKRKLLSLKPQTRLRKIQRLLQEVQEGRLDAHPRDLQDVLSCLEEFSFWRQAQPLVKLVLGASQEQNPGDNPRAIHQLRAILLSVLGESLEDWDFAYSPLDRQMRQTIGVSLFLEDLRSPFNLGSLFRTAEAFGLEEMVLSPFCVDPQQPRAQRSSMGTTELMPWRRGSLEDLGDRPLVALELGGKALGDFIFPNTGVLALGSEELGLSSAVKDRARGSGGLVSIPLYGAKRSLNVAVAAGIALQAWSQQLRTT
jgi:TrmH family RNA methyltransferase